MTDVIQVNTSPLALQKRIMCTVIVHYFIVNFTSPLLCHDDVVCRRSKKKQNSGAYGVTTVRQVRQEVETVVFTVRISLGIR